MATHDVLEVLSFDRSKGMKKCRRPFVREKIATEKAEALDKNFCKKDPETGIQKQIRCLACYCQMESCKALKAHLKGEKHNKAVETYIPESEKVMRPLRQLISDFDGHIFALNKVQEFISPHSDDEKGKAKIPVYKCLVFPCGGAYGASEDFFKHLCSKGHADSFIKQEKLVGHVDMNTRDQLSSKDVSLIEVIEDKARYWIQRNHNTKEVGRRFILYFTTAAFQLMHMTNDLTVFCKLSMIHFLQQYDRARWYHNFFS
jgi:hypothetical protein